MTANGIWEGLLAIFAAPIPPPNKSEPVTKLAVAEKHMAYIFRIENISKDMRP